MDLGEGGALFTYWKSERPLKSDIEQRLKDETQVCEELEEEVSS